MAVTLWCGSHLLFGLLLLRLKLEKAALSELIVSTFYTPFFVTWG